MKEVLVNWNIAQASKITISKCFRLKYASGWKSYISSVHRNLANSEEESDQSAILEPLPPVYMNPSLQTLTRKQRRLVSRNPGVLRTIKRSAAVAAGECNYQFTNRRWNCPIEDDSHGGSIYGKIIRKGEQRML